MSPESPVHQLPDEGTELQFEVFYPRVTPEQLFAWWTTPALLCKWWTDAAETEPQSGGSYQLHWRALKITLRGIYRVYEPGTRLDFSWHWDHEPERPERLVSLRFAAEEGGTRLRLTHGTYGEQDESERQEHLDGWMYFLEVLYRQFAPVSVTVVTAD